MFEIAIFVIDVDGCRDCAV